MSTPRKPPETPNMKLAKATQSEIDTLMQWLQERDAEKFEDAKHRPPAFLRVLAGYELLLRHCCDPEKDYVDWKPGIIHSDEQKMALAQAIAEQLDHPSTRQMISREGIAAVVYQHLNGNPD